MRRHREKNSVRLKAVINYRYILNECRSLKVKVNKPRSIKSFLEALAAVKNAKKKASNLLFEEIEHDV